MHIIYYSSTLRVSPDKGFPIESFEDKILEQAAFGVLRRDAARYFLNLFKQK